ncbi:mavicyanin-like [Phalaenopsis equestris]|uniref:mavicyanin-like n=1 Tax=Phalaenopsis equestris TaxID=78828 RepID=UPI0009E2543C|nr:mavicyanin-like [Phalaenopsis equestris]
MDSSVKSWLLIAVTMVVWTGPARSAKIFTVGDSTGWTIINSPNYTLWASNKAFHQGDTLLFKYNKQFHNVLEVKEADFTACKNTSAIKEYDTGDDSITIKSVGHSYFICGFPGHCQGGQKVDILAVDSSAAPSSSPSDSSPPPPNAGDRLATGASVFIGSLIMVVSCGVVLLGF